MKPISIRIINGLLIFRCIVILTTLSVTGYVIYSSPEPGVLTGIADGTIEAVGIETPIINANKSFGMVIGYSLPTIMILLLELSYVKNRKTKGFLIVMGIDVLIAIALRNLPLLAIIILLLGLTKKSKIYFKNKHRN
ncbi:MAG: hypothetical protein WCW27_06755 [Patescibacteria group bacterium]|jgi:hypothetical protein